MSYFCQRSNKKNAIYKCLSGCDKRYKKTLVIHTCYLDSDLSAAKEFIGYMRTWFRYIEKVKIYVDEGEVQKKYMFIPHFLSSFRGIEVSLYVVQGNCLFHSKTYALLAFENDKVVSAGLAVGSGNLSNNGVTSQMGNYECFLSSADVGDAQEFWDDTLRLNAIPFVEWTPKTTASLEEMIVNSGIFLHLWSDNDHSKQSLAIKYDLTDLQKLKIQDGQTVLNELGFDVNADTISKQYFDLPLSDVSVKGWKRKFLLETYLGYWIPQIVLLKLTNKNKDSFDKFKKKVCDTLIEQFESLKDEIDNDYARLVKLRIILKKEADNPLEEYLPSVYLKRKIDALCNNEVALKRLYYKYEQYEFPFEKHSLGYKGRIDTIFNDLNDSAMMNKSKIVSKKFIEAKKGDLFAFNTINP